MQIHKLSDVQSKKIGEGTTIWQYCIVLSKAVIGKNCNICSHCFIENNVVIGDRVTIKNGVYIFDFIEIEDDVFIGPNVTFTNDTYPRSHREKNKPQTNYTKTKICKGASIGGGATIIPGITIGEKAIVGAGAVVTKDIEAGTIVYSEEAKFRRMVVDV
jgi:UDP-2-acetamido-3-amino-2,3-dideoxy-glucuronate N-acetyltransferase